MWFAVPTTDKTVVSTSDVLLSSMLIAILPALIAFIIAFTTRRRPEGTIASPLPLIGLALATIVMKLATPNGLALIPAAFFVWSIGNAKARTEGEGTDQDRSLPHWLWPSRRNVATSYVVRLGRTFHALGVFAAVLLTIGSIIALVRPESQTPSRQAWQTAPIVTDTDAGDAAAPNYFDRYDNRPNADDKMLSIFGPLITALICLAVGRGARYILSDE
jgi:hypothetical protein